MSQTSKKMDEYFSYLEKGIKEGYDCAHLARLKGYDPSLSVEIPLARDMAERVEGLISVAASQLKGSGVSQRIKALEEQYGSQNWRISFLIAEEVAFEKFCKFKDKKEAMEVGLRVGLAYITNGVVASPLEGFVRLELKKREDGKGEYFCLYFGGPIRSAGTTATCIFVAVCDYVRLKMGYAPYDPTSAEINRTFSELEHFHDRITNLQYFPSKKEADFLSTHLPIQIDGDPSEKIDVPNYKDLPRVSTNKLRNGFCLVVAEGLCQKFAKFWGKFSKFYKELGMDSWIFLEEYVALQKEIRAKGKSKGGATSKIVPDYHYIKDIVAGRPVLGHPLGIGTFRIRLGRARTTGLSDDAIHPATMVVLDDFIAYGTQLKTERPGKSTVISSCDTLEGPIVKLKNGDVVFVDTEEQARSIVKDIKEIIFLGDILINYGYFLNRGHPLVPVGYNEDWWALELEKAVGDTKEEYEEFFLHSARPSFDFSKVFNLSKAFKIPLHPKFTFHWKDLLLEQFLSLVTWLDFAVLKTDKLILPMNGEDPRKRILELLGVPHKCVNEEYVVLEGDWALAFRANMGFLNFEYSSAKILAEVEEGISVLHLINKISEVFLRDKSGTFMGSRMGRPEKAKMRKLTGSPHTMFPVGWEGGRLRCFGAALETGKITADFSLYFCESCKKETVYSKCHLCEQNAKQLFFCKQCDSKTGDCGHDVVKYKKIELPLREYFDNALKKFGGRNYPELIKGVRGTSNKAHIPEHLLKGILRASHDIYVNKDGTTRYDMTEMSLTHFKPKEIRTSLEVLKRLGYTHDVWGKELTSEDQILELKCQDLVLPSCPESTDEGADFVLFRVAAFIDDLLKKLYELPGFYNLTKREELVGHLVVGLSPHTSAGIVGRIIGFSKTQVMLCNPLFHSIMRRDCVHPTTKFLCFDKENKLYYVNIGIFVDSLIEQGCETRTLDMVGTLAVYPRQEYFTYGADPLTKAMVKRKIKYFIKGPVDKNWVKIKTSTNRELQMTLNHDFMTLNSEKNIQSKKAKDIVVGDSLLVMDYLDFPKKEELTLDLLKEFIEHLPLPLKNKFRVIHCESFFKQLVVCVGKKEIIKIIQASQHQSKTLFEWYKQVPLDHLEKLILAGKLDYVSLPQQLKIKYWFSTFLFERYLKITPELCKLLGIYTAEGHFRENKTTKQVSFRICNSLLQESVFSWIFSVFKIKPTLEENKTKITISHAFVYCLFKYVLKIGTCAKNKKIPSLIYSLSDDFVSDYISAYIDGNGSVLPQRRGIVLYSTHRSLLDDFALLISRFHAVGRYATIKERLPGKTLIDKYTSLGKDVKKFGLHHLIFRGIDSIKLGTKLNLNHPIKARKLMILISMNVTSNVLKFNRHYVPIHSFGDSFIDYVKAVEFIEDEKNSYCLAVEDSIKENKNVIWGEQIINFQCDGDEATVMLLMDALLNFSPKLLSNHRGATQDEPLVLTTTILPTEVDDMVFDIDIAWKYPLELYEACLEYKPASEIKIKTLKEVLNMEGQYEGWGFTHDTTNFNRGIMCSSYKTLPTMQDKVQKQMFLCEKLRAVDVHDVARLVIERHFIRDIKGNLRKFSMQQFRCVGCNEKFRRPPLKGTCTKCNGKILFTISEGSVIKYLEPSLSLAERYNLPPFLKQTLNLAKQRIDLLFGKEKEKQEGLGKWFA